MQNTAKHVAVWVFAIIVFVTSTIATGQYLVRASVQHDLEMIGLDWARYIEVRLEGLIAPAIINGRVDQNHLPSNATFVNAMKKVMLIGHVTQIDIINADCLCEVSYREDIKQDTAVSKAGSDDHTSHDHGWHDHSSQTPTFSSSGTLKSVAQPSGPMPKQQASSADGFLQVDREHVRRILATGEPETILSNLDLPGQPSRVANIYYPIEINGSVLFVLRLVIDLDNSILFFRSVFGIGGAGLIALFLLCMWAPLRSYLHAIERARAAHSDAVYRAEHDPLTGTANRDAFYRRTVETLAADIKVGRTGLIVMVDIDHFKEINDYHGHQTGDNILIQVTQSLQRRLGNTATISRHGGDEFVVHIQEADLSLLPELNAAAAPTRINGLGGSEDVHVSLSIGVAVYPDDGTTLQSLLQAADLALYDSKTNGRATARSFVPALRDAFDRRVSLLSRFRDENALDLLVPYYQPLVDLETGHVRGLEALLRWEHPDRGVLSAAEFHEIFDDSQIARRIGPKVLRDAVRDRETWVGVGVAPQRIGINAEQADLLYPEFQWTLDELHESGRIEPDDLIIEITEKCIFGTNRDRMLSRIDALKQVGCKIALDDFGAGFTSITQLRDIPRDSVKIDKSFIDKVDVDDHDAAIVRSVVTLGKSMDFLVIAEGLETESQISMVRELGCRLGQGYYFSKAVPAADVPAMIERVTREFTERKALAG